MRTIAAILTVLGLFALSAYIHPVTRSNGKLTFHQIHTDLEKHYGEDPTAKFSGPKTKLPVIPIAPANAEAEALQKILIKQYQERK